MNIPQEKIAEFRVAQLEMVQAIIARIAGYGAAIKNWCITVTTAVCGFSITVQKPFVVLLALLPIITFAFLDAQYLRVERQFRNTRSI
jgi:histidine triad (HIT) family protein